MSLPRHPRAASQATPARRRRPATAATRRPKRDTGPDHATRIRVYERDGYCCVACGRSVEFDLWRSIQHRVARGVGGGNDLTNLATLCGSATSAGCHQRAESRDEDMHQKGYWLRSNENPAEIPIWLVTEFSSRWVLLTADGHREDYYPDDPDDPRWAPPRAA